MPNLLKSHPALVLVFGTLFSLLLFYNLGHYALWDDEAFTALGAKSLLAEGDISILVDGGKNIFTGTDMHEGITSRHLYERANAPLPYYLMAGSFYLFGQSAGTARLLPALLGLLGVGLIFWKIGSSTNSRLTLALLAIAFCCNVSLLLFLREARYFGPFLFFAAIITSIYADKELSRRQIILFIIATVCLYLTQYLLFVAFYIALTADYLLFKLRYDSFPLKKALSILMSAALICGIFFIVLDPIHTDISTYAKADGLKERAMLWWWQWRDMNACEYGSFGMALLIFIAGIRYKDRWILRGITAIFIYALVIAIASPQTVKNITVVADVRYLFPVIPLLIVISVRAIVLFWQRVPEFAIAFALFAFGSNILNGGFLLPQGTRVTIVKYVGELIHPNPEPITPAAEWIRKNIPKNGTVWVIPNEFEISLLFAAPDPVYAWVLSYPPKKQFEGLPEIFFRGVLPPDYIICFGPAWPSIMQALEKSGRADLKYQQVATLDYFWKDLYRPELFWRTFDPIENYNKDLQAIYIFKRIASP